MCTCVEFYGPAIQAVKSYLCLWFLKVGMFFIFRKDFAESSRSKQRFSEWMCVLDFVYARLAYVAEKSNAG